LRATYAKARYSRKFRKSEDELTWLGERIAVLQALVRTLCVERIDTLAKAA
jgi:uncharacterized protein